MTIAKRTIQKGNLKIDVDERILDVEYFGQDYRALLSESLSEALNGGDRSKLQSLCDELFTAARELDEKDKAVELSIHLTNYCFETFGGAWDTALSKGAGAVASTIMSLSCGLAWEWESKSTPYQLHKGTPYYFLAMSLLLSGNIDSAFVMVHNAIEEDKRTYPLLGMDYASAAPAYSFASLDFSNKLGTMRPFVEEMQSFLEKYIAVHNESSGAGFRLTNLSKKFLKNRALEDEKFFFVYNLMLIINMNKLTHPRLLINAFSALRNIDLLFNLSLIADKIVEHRYGTRYLGSGVIRILGEIEGIQEKDHDALMKKLQFANGDRFEVNDDPEKVIPALIRDDVRYAGKALSYLMTSLLCAWNLRNYGAHHVGGGANVTTTLFSKTLNLLFSALFFSVSLLN